MTTAEVQARRAARDTLRDAGSHNDVPPGKGPNSTVSPRAMTERAIQVAALTGGPRQPSGLSGDLATSFNAGTVPTPTQGQARPGTGDGARDSTQANQRGTGRDGQTR